jgi:hypothetical protein
MTASTRVDAVTGAARVIAAAGHQGLHRLAAYTAAAMAFCCSPDGAVTNGSAVHAGGGFPG